MFDSASTREQHFYPGGYGNHAADSSRHAQHDGDLASSASLPVEGDLTGAVAESASSAGSGGAQTLAAVDRANGRKGCGTGQRKERKDSEPAALASTGSRAASDVNGTGPWTGAPIPVGLCSLDRLHSSLAPIGAVAAHSGKGPRGRGSNRPHGGKGVALGRGGRSGFKTVRLGGKAQHYNKEINRQVTLMADLGDISQLLEVVQAYLPDMNGLNLATAFHRVAKLSAMSGDVGNQKAQLLQGHPVFRELFQEVQVHVMNHSLSDGTAASLIVGGEEQPLPATQLPYKSCRVANQPEGWEMPMQCMSIVTWSCATMRIRDRILFGAIAQIIGTRLDDLKSFEFSNLLWAYAKVALIPPDLFSNAGARLLRRHAGEFKAQCLSTIAWSFATAERRDSEVFQTLAQEIKENACNLKTQEISNTLWAFARSRSVDPELFSTLGHAALEEPRIWMFKPQELSNTVWAFATVGLHHPQLFDKVERAAVQKRHDMVPQNVANILWAYAKLQVPAAGIFMALLEGTLGKLSQYKRQELSTVIWAAAQVCPQHREFFGAASRLCCHRLKEFSPHAVANLTRDLSHVETDAPELFGTILREGARRLPQFDPGALCILLRGALTAAMSPALQDSRGDVLEVLRAICDHLVPRVRRLRVVELHDLSDALWTRVPGCEALEHAVKQEVQERGEARGLRVAAGEWEPAAVGCQGAAGGGEAAGEAEGEAREVPEGEGSEARLARRGERGAGSWGVAKRSGAWGWAAPGPERAFGERAGCAAQSSSAGGARGGAHTPAPCFDAGVAPPWAPGVFTGPCNMWPGGRWPPGDFNCRAPFPGGCGEAYGGAEEWRPGPLPQELPRPEEMLGWPGGDASDREHRGWVTGASCRGESQLTWDRPPPEWRRELSFAGSAEGGAGSGGGRALPHAWGEEGAAEYAPGGGGGAAWLSQGLKAFDASCLTEEGPEGELQPADFGAYGAAKVVGAGGGQRICLKHGLLDARVVLKWVPGKAALPAAAEEHPNVLQPLARVTVEPAGQPGAIWGPGRGAAPTQYVAYLHCRHGNLAEWMQWRILQGRPVSIAESAHIVRLVLCAAEFLLQQGPEVLSILQPDEIFMDEAEQPKLRRPVPGSTAGWDDHLKWISPKEASGEVPHNSQDIWPALAYRVGLLLYFTNAGIPTEPYPQKSGETVLMELLAEVCGNGPVVRPDLNAYQGPEILKRLVAACLQPGGQEPPARAAVESVLSTMALQAAEPAALYL